jgi:hypothetical protein
VVQRARGPNGPCCCSRTCRATTCAWCCVRPARRRARWSATWSSCAARSSMWPARRTSARATGREGAFAAISSTT